MTVDNFVRAETDLPMRRYIALGGFGKSAQVWRPTPIDQLGVIRMNRHTF